MSDIKNLLVEEYVAKERYFFERMEEKLRETPMTHDQKMDCYESIIKKGITFGIDKGIFLEQTRRDKIQRAMRLKRERLVDKMIFDLNDDIMKYKNLPKVKYNKKKYRKPKGVIQLNFLKAFGFNADIR